MAVTDAVEYKQGWVLSDWLGLQEEVSNNWFGFMEVESKLHLFGEAIAIQVFNETATSTLDLADTTTILHKMVMTIAESLALTDVVSPKMTYNPVILESLAITGAVSILKTIYESVTDNLTVADTTGITWLKSVSESLAVADTAAITYYAMEILTESLALTETALINLTFNDTISETLNAASTAAMKHIINETIEETLNLGVIVELDDELWECWVLNTNAFHASVYSGYSFNSYAVHNKTAYGCKSDGVYKLSGDDDDGTDFLSGIVLPETNFGTTRDKRFRKAYFGLSGGTTPALRVTTDTGSTTYTIESEQVNITRDMKGKKWVLKVQDFSDLSFIELVPIILAR